MNGFIKISLLKGSKNQQISGSHSGGGCCGGSGGGGEFGLSNTEALIFLAALAFAVAFLNQQITMFLGGGRRRKRREDNANIQANESKLVLRGDISRSALLIRLNDMYLNYLKTTLGILQCFQSMYEHQLLWLAL